MGSWFVGHRLRGGVLAVLAFFPTTVKAQSGPLSGMPTVAGVDLNEAGPQYAVLGLVGLVLVGIIVCVCWCCCKRRNTALSDLRGRDVELGDVKGNKAGKGHQRKVSGDDGKSEVRQNIRLEVLNTERSYVEGLTVMNNIYLATVETMAQNPKSYGGSDQDINALRLNIKTLYELHVRFLGELEKEKLLFMAPIIDEYADYFKIYIDYLNGYEACLQVMDRLKKKNKHFAETMTAIDDKIRDSGGCLALQSYMIMPVQRVPRYVLLLKELIKNSNSTHPQWASMNAALKKVEKIALAVNEGQRRMENMQELNELNAALNGQPKDFTLVQAKRSLVKKGPLIMTLRAVDNERKVLTQDKERMVFLFSDILLVTSHKFRFRDAVDVATGHISLSEEDDCEFEFSSHKFALAFRCENAAEREKWAEAIMDASEELKDSRKVKEDKGARQTKARHHNHASSFLQDSLRNATLK